MRNTLSSIAILLFFFQFTLSAQTIDDALRFSQLIPGGTARVIGAGSSFGAMGGDYGVTAINVAGLSDFRRNEVMFSLSLNQPSTTSDFEGRQIGTSSDGTQVLIESMAFILHTKPYNDRWATSNFSFGFQQYTNYEQVFSYQVESIGSIAEGWEDVANDLGFRDCQDCGLFDARLAIDAGALLDTEFEGEQFFLSELFFEDFTNKEQVIERSGSFNELQFAWGGKLKSGLSLGIGIGVPLVSFEENKFYAEEFVGDLESGFDNLRFNESLTTSGFGINAKVGIGYNIKNKVRLGLSYQSPTWLRLEDLFFNSLQYNGGALQESPTGGFTYSLRTPMRATASIGTMANFDKIKGFLNLDVQYINYGANSFNLSGDFATQADLDFQDFLNDDIENSLNDGYNFTIGGELVYNRFRGRAGFTAQVKPFLGEVGTDNIIAAGLGYRANQFYVDLAYQFRSIAEGYTPYLSYFDTPERELFLINESDLHKLVLTFGVKI